MSEHVESAGMLPRGIAKGDPVVCLDATVLRKKTSPPARWTEGTLIEAMSKIHLYVTDPEVKAGLKESSGIGTEATRAATIETLKKRNFVKLTGKGKSKGKHIVSTDLGRMLIDNAPFTLTDPGTTAAWEEGLRAVEAGRITEATFMEAMAATLSPLLDETLRATFEGCGVTIHKCPECGSPLKRIKSKKGGHFWACFNETAHEKPVFMDDVKGEPRAREPEKTAPCPDCGGVMRQKRSRKNSKWVFWACSNENCPLRRDENGAPGDVFDSDK